jgi:hypothetical protein
MRLWGLIAVLMLAAAACVHAPENWGTPWDKFIGQKDVKVTLTKDKAGNEVRTIDLPSGVSATQTRKPDGNIETLEMDNSGLGAVMCAWRITIMMREEIVSCPEDKARKLLRVEMDAALDKFEAFIVTNSLTPLSRNDLLILRQKANTEDEASRVVRGHPKKCPPLALEKVRNTEEISKALLRPIAIARPPVMNPCL